MADYDDKDVVLRRMTKIMTRVMMIMTMTTMMMIKCMTMMLMNFTTMKRQMLVHINEKANVNMKDYVRELLCY